MHRYKRFHYSPVAISLLILIILYVVVMIAGVEFTSDFTIAFLHGNNRGVVTVVYFADFTALKFVGFLNLMGKKN